jgi:hypothetical protein
MIKVSDFQELKSVVSELVDAQIRTEFEILTEKKLK